MKVVGLKRPNSKTASEAACVSLYSDPLVLVPIAYKFEIRAVCQSLSPEPEPEPEESAGSVGSGFLGKIGFFVREHPELSAVCDDLSKKRFLRLTRIERECYRSHTVSEVSEGSEGLKNPNFPKGEKVPKSPKLSVVPEPGPRAAVPRKSLTDLRHLGDAFREVRWTKDPFIVTGNGKEIAAVVSMEDFETLQKLKGEKH